MPSPNDKFKKIKYTKTIKNNVRKVVKKKTQKHKCAICKTPLNGVAHGKRAFEVLKLKKTQRRPENPLASMVCPKCRKDIYLEAIMLKYNIIDKKDIDLRYNKYIDMLKNKIE